MRRWGPVAMSNGRARFQLWAPAQQRLALAIDGQAPQPMQAETGGWFTLEAEAPPGTSYRFLLDDGSPVPDPASRAQKGGVHGWSVMTDTAAYRWQHRDWQGRPWEEAVIQEVHAGLCGGFAGLMRDLPRIAALGITAIELMPVAAVSGARNWGYDGVLPFAPAEALGTPRQLQALVDAAHGLGLMVLLDVVYNHFGPDGHYIPNYAPSSCIRGRPRHGAARWQSTGPRWRAISARTRCNGWRTIVLTGCVSMRCMPLATLRFWINWRRICGQQWRRAVLSI
jgi:maltooligosyltrehalose trehalohydrolase